MMLDALGACFEGGLPASLATVSAGGQPNITLLWQVHRIDEHTLAVADQFFDKTRANLADHPFAVLRVTDPETGTQWELTLRHCATETSGPIYRQVQGRLACIGARAGLGSAYPLRAVDRFEVEQVVCCSPMPAPRTEPAGRHLPAVKALGRALAGADDLAKALDETLAGLATHFDMTHSLILCMDETSQWLYTVASHGYGESGAGTEVRVAEGIIGIAAQLRTPIRSSYLAATQGYGQALRAQAVSSGLLAIDTEIRPPGLAEPQSQLAVPIEAGDWLAGVLYVESPRTKRYTQDDEDALTVVAHQLGLAMRLLLQPPDTVPSAEAQPTTPLARAPQSITQVRYFAATQSVFLDEAYLIKGVAGAILWLLLCDYTEHGRVDFSNRELRLDPRLKLPEIDDNLETRLLLLARRLASQCHWLRLEKVGRGRFRVCVGQPIRLVDMAQSTGRAITPENAAP